MTDPRAIYIENNAEGIPISYACEFHLGTDLSQVSAERTAEVVEFYDLVFPCSMSDEKQSVANFVAEQLLERAALTWNILESGEGCLEPQDAYNSWVFGVSSGEPDVFISDFGCQRLTVGAEECCQVVRSTTTFYPTGEFQITNLEDFVRTQLNSGELTAALDDLRTAVIDPVFVDPGDGPENARDNLGTPPPRPSESGGVMAGVEEEKSPAEPGNGKITVTGGFLMGALVAAVLGVGFILYRRYRKRRQTAIAVGDGKVGDDDGTFEHGQSGDDEPFRVSVLSDDAPDFINRDTSALSYHSDEDVVAPPKYAFDLSQSFKNDVMGTYFRSGPQGPTTMQVVAPYPILDETSDSEADSWAQTDGTVGSLEERLEEITAEI